MDSLRVQAHLTSIQSALGRFFLDHFQLFFELLDFLFDLFNLTGNLRRGGSAFGGQQGFAAIGAATPARVFRFELGRVGLVNDQAIVVIQFFTGLDVAQGFDEDAVVLFIGFTVGVAAVVDPSGRVAAVQRVDHFVFVHMKIERVIGVGRVMGVTVLRLVPADDFTHILKQCLAFGKVLQRKYALAVDAGAANLHAAARCR